MQHQIVMTGREAYSLPSQATMIRVLEGTAWVSRSGLDFVLSAGEYICTASHSDKVVIAPARSGQLVIEVANDA